ncbi:MAG: homoserine dehydrogenase [Clostridia bacterium]
MKVVNIGIMGMGTVGSGIYKVIESEGKRIEHREDMELRVKRVLALDYSIPIPESLKTSKIEDLINDDEITIIAEVMGGIEPAKSFIIKALQAGKTVVTANKELLAKHWPELELEAKKTGAGLYFEASVGGGIPILRTVSDSMQANSIDTIFAIINGTTNFILTKMTDEGREFADVLAEAQALGYAEANPTNDVEAFDAMYKLSILASMAFHARIPIDQIYREGITKITKEDIGYAKELGYEIKLLAIGKKTGTTVEVRVHPTMLHKEHPMASVKGSFNAIFMHGNAVGDVMLYGRGAGDLPTASAIISDMIYASKVNEHKYATFANTPLASEKVIFNNNWETEYFVHIHVVDRPGVMAKITKILADYDVSIQSVIQKGRVDAFVPVIIVTHDAKELDMKKALAEIEALPDVVKLVNCIRVEK